MGDGCFSGYPARHLTFRRTRCASTHCDAAGSGRDVPRAHSLWVAGDHHHIDASNPRFWSAWHGQSGRCRCHREGRDLLY